MCVCQKGRRVNVIKSSDDVRRGGGRQEEQQKGEDIRKRQNLKEGPKETTTPVGNPKRQSLEKRGKKGADVQESWKVETQYCNEK